MNNPSGKKHRRSIRLQDYDFHGILVIDNDIGIHPEGENMVSPLQKCDVGVDPCVNPINGLPRFIRWFKTMTTNRYIKNVHENNWEPFHQKLWQRNYYEHIVRNEKELEKTRYYINENPAKWDDDKYNLANDKELQQKEK